MKTKQIKKSIILGSVALALTSSWAIADDQNDDNTIIVTANRVEQNVNDVLAVTEVISREDIERIQPESITDLLTTVAGFDLAHNGGAGQSTSLFSRGTDSTQTLVVVNGIRVGSATLGIKDYATIPVAQIERIEIIKGPRATLWGSDATGGVIQIFTRKLDNGEYSVSASFGNDDYRNVSASIGFGSDNITNTLSLTNEYSEGYDVIDNSTITTPDLEPDSDGYSRSSIAINGGFGINSQQRISWTLQKDKGSREFDNGFSGDETNYDNDLFSLKHYLSIDNLSTEITLGQSKDEAVTFGSLSSGSYIPESEGGTFETKKSQVNLFAAYRLSESLQFAGGLDRYKDDVSGTTLVYEETERTIDSAFVSALYDEENIIAEASVRRDDIERVDTSETFNLGLGYRLTNELTISANRSEGFKAPTFNQLYYPNSGNPDLKPEVSFNNEIVFKANFENESLILALYENRLYQPSVIENQSIVNIDQARLKGYEVIYQYNHPIISHEINLTSIDAKDSSTGEQLRRRAKIKAGYQIDIDYERFSVFTQINYSGKRSDNGGITLDSFIQTNLGVVYTANDNWKYTFKINDIGNERPVTANTFSINNYNTPGRQLFLGFQYNNFND